ncbi:TIGR03084 family metal-binding protein [Amycolatopsis anabasis]|uniref:TIGR03084 family metal-binding protein n=1 Tax=Amycolatopsis anabasis TaxID=1840409 RepID=UPI00131C3859|nr:TIGR03084 family metal-binding protein [Amycolatopsis anabasis]
MTRPKEVISDFVTDGEELDRAVATLRPEQWELPTPAPGWTIAHQVAHLTATFNLAALAASDPAAFTRLANGLSDDFAKNVEDALAPYLAKPPDELLTHWRGSRSSAANALLAAPPEEMLPWLVNPLPPAILAAAGVMELFAHGQDIFDALGVSPARTDRIRHLVAFSVRTWTFGYVARGLPVPDVAFRFELVAPSGALWTYGPADGDQTIRGPAVDFCLLTTRRRHRADLALRAVGADADHWLDIAQAYRGPAGAGRRPGQFATTAAKHT